MTREEILPLLCRLLEEANWLYAGGWEAGEIAAIAMSHWEIYGWEFREDKTGDVLRACFMDFFRIGARFPRPADILERIGPIRRALELEARRRAWEREARRRPALERSRRKTPHFGRLVLAALRGDGRADELVWSGSAEDAAAYAASLPPGDEADFAAVMAKGGFGR